MLAWPPSALLLGSVSLILLTIACLELARHNWWQERWQERGFDLSLLDTPVWVASRFLFSFSSGFLAAIAYDSWSAGVAFASSAWVAITAVSTDLACGKIAKEPAWLNLAVTATMAFVGSSPAGWASAVLAILALAFVLGLAAILSRGKLGMGDIRLLLSLAPLAAWSGWTAVLVGIALAGILQIPFRPLLKKLNVFPGTPYLPFAPALVAGVTISLLFLGQPDAPCDEWATLLSCNPTWF